MIDKNGKLFGKISLIDIAVILVILVTIAGAVLTFRNISEKQPDSVKKTLSGKALENLEITLCVKNIRQMTVDALQVGDDVFLTEKKEYLGEIISKEIKPATLLIFDHDGNAVHAENPERMDVTIVIRAQGKVNDGAYFTPQNAPLFYDSLQGISTPTLLTIPNVKEIKIVPGE